MSQSILDLKKNQFFNLYSVVNPGDFMEKSKKKKIQNLKKLMCLTCNDSKFNFLRQYQAIKLSEL